MNENQASLEHKKLLERFYKAFQELDWETMGACYHKEANFQDPGFTLKGAEVGMMWKMLCLRAKEFSLDFRVIEVDANKGIVEWEANYLFSKTGRKVNNKIRANIVFKDGLIYQHEDVFDFWRWSRQALGLPAYLLGWAGFFQKAVSKQAMGQLEIFQKSH
jgi:ketosteroid isomerase-like protein